MDRKFIIYLAAFSVAFAMHAASREVSSPDGRTRIKVDIGEKIGKYVVLRTNRDGINIRSIDHRKLVPLDLCSDCARELTEFIEGYADAEDQGNGNEI